MERVDLIVCGKYIVTADYANRVIPKGAIAIRSGQIVDVGGESEIRSKYIADEIIEKRHHLITPGLIDCHTHTQQYLLRSAVNDLMLQLPPIWTKVLVPFERMMGEKLAELSTRASIANMLKNGITYFIEAGAPYPEILAQEVLASGIKGVITYATYDITDDKVAEPWDILKRVEALLKTYGVVSNDLRVWMSLRQVMMVSEELMNRVIELSEKYATGLTMHLAEYQGEVDYVLSKYGVRPLKYMVEKGLDRVKPVVLAHGLFLSPGELELIKKYGFGVCWCPTVDSWLMGIHWAGYVDLKNVKIGIGSDGGAWNKLDLLHEAKIAKSVGKAVTNALLYFKAGLDSSTLLNMITGSKGLITNDKVGRIEKGYSADLTIFDSRNIKTLPVHDPVEALLNYMEGDNVTDVMINGKFIVKESRLITVNEEKIVEDLMNEEENILEILKELLKQIKLH